MSALAPIAILDGKATPVSQTFTPVGVMNGWQAYALRPSGRNDLASFVMLRFRESGSAGQPARIDAKIKYLTTMVDVDGNTVKKLSCMSEHTFTLAPNSETSHREDILALAANLLANAQVVDLIENLIPPYDV